MKIYLIADTHFGHRKYFSQEAEDAFRSKLLTLLYKFEKDDLLIHLGDVCFGGDSSWNNFFGNLGYRSWLIRGNHDKKSTHYYLRVGWSFVGEQAELELWGKKVLLSHKPLDIFGSFYDKNIHGHLHGDEHRIAEIRFPLVNNILIKPHQIVQLTEKLIKK